MKSILSIFLCCLLLLSLCACGQQAAESSTTQVVNPIRTVDSPEDFPDDLSLYLTAPENAEDVSFTVISGEIAQIRYTYNGREFTHRCAETTEDISGVYGPFIPYDSIGVLIDHHSGSYTVRTKYPTDGGAVAIWQIGDHSYSLYTPDEMEVTAFDDYAAYMALAYINQAYPAS